MDNNLNEIQEQTQTNAPVQKLLPQEEVNDIVRNAHSRGYAKAEREYQNKLQELENKYAELSSKPQVSEEQLAEKVANRMREESQAMQQRLEEQKIEEQERALANKYLENIKKGEVLFDDFKDKMKHFDPREFPNVARMAAELDGEETAESIYHLIDTPEKMASLDELFKRSPSNGRRRFKDYVDSVKKNKESIDSVRRVDEPLSKAKPSVSGSGNNKMPSIAQMKNDPRFRF